ncbi:MAG TPA: SDR family oxidoreductase [Chitinophagales bacterium]|nr:SDR family oxidoreductase [Chitinophagales bacterium]
MTKTILITGASTGIGKETALYFADKGWNVSATMRTMAKGAGLLKYKNIRVFQLDVMDTSSIQQAIQDTIAAFGAIDVLFNNAGYALVGAFEAMTQEQIKKQFDTNVFGVMNVTKAILPYFREKKNGTIITTSSMGGLITFPLYSVYHSTKWAIEGFMESLQYELKPFNIRIKNIEPGAIKTEFGNSLDFVTADAYKNYVPRVHQNMLDSYESAPGADVVAKEVYKAANDSSFRLRYTASFQSTALLFIRRIIPNNWFFGIIRSATEKGIK